MLAKVSAQASHGTCSMDREKSDRGAYGRLSADFSADQQDTSAIVQIAGKLGSPGRWSDGTWEALGNWAGPPFPLVPAEEGDEEI